MRYVLHDTDTHDEYLVGGYKCFAGLYQIFVTTNGAQRIL